MPKKVVNMKYKIKTNFILKTFYFISIAYTCIFIMGFIATSLHAYNIINNCEKAEGINLNGFVTFKASDNKIYNIENTSNLFEENEKVIIYYDLNNMKEVEYHEIMMNDVETFGFISLLGIIIYIILQIILSKKNKRERFIIKNGKKVTGRIIEVVRVNDSEGNYSYLKCEYDSVIDDILYFSSQKIYSNKIYKSKFNKGTATIYYLPKDTGSYVVTDCILK